MGTEDTISSGIRTRPAAAGSRTLRWLVVLGVAALALAVWSRYPTAPKLAIPAPDGDRVVASERIRADAISALRTSLAREVGRLRSATAAALDVPEEQEAAFDRIPKPGAGDPEWGLVVYDDGRRHVWSGRLRIATDSLVEPLSLSVGRFYTTVNVAATRGSRRAVGSLVLHAEPPGDRLADAADEAILSRHPVATFTYTVGANTGGAAVLLRDSGGAPLLGVDAVALSPGEIRLNASARARTRLVLVLALVLFALLGVAYHSRRLAHRAVALAVFMACIGIVPLNAFSNASRWFNPSYYYSAAGGRWTANAAALTLTAVVVLLGVYALIRARARPRGRALAVIASVVAAGSGLYLLDLLARGIGQPPRGSTMALWLSWQVPLFLICFALLALAAWVVSGLARRPRPVTGVLGLSVAVAAGILASYTVWSTTTVQRMTLAEADVASLRSGDEYAAALLARLSEELSGGRPPVSRADLLQRYVASELAIAGYPLSLRSWTGDARPIASFDAARVAQDSAAIAEAVEQAIATGEPVRRDVLSGAGLQQLLVVPHERGATSVAVLPRTRLVPADPFGPLLGLPAPLPESPPYAMYLADRPASGMAGPPDTVVWRRIGEELHSDAVVETMGGPARVHLEVDTRSPWALFQRLVLVVLLNVALAWLIWILTLAAEGGAMARARVRARQWARSYRARLTLALFVFFMAPAVAFSLWSYRRLRSDFRQTRQLVVRETLNAVTAAGAERSVASVGDRFGLPLFVYRRGMLSETSDSLYWDLAPAGLALPPGVFQTLDIGDEITASRGERVGGADVLFGYRASVGAGGERYVIAAPARGDDDALARRRGDLGVLLLFATALGAIGALWLSGIAARQFALPIDALRRSVRAAARGERDLPLSARPPTEFSEAFTAVRRMADDLDASRRESARAERVLAWGEMARQVAHEIKNPLTPMRLGVQHLQRARHDPRVDFDAVFDSNMQRMLEEIDRLDNIARAFSRYGSAQPDLPPAEPVDVAAIVSDVIVLERMSGGDVEWRATGMDHPAMAMATRDELREVLLNVLENARHAGARTVEVALERTAAGVTISVEDDGSGIPAATLPKIFEPHFSTRTTGSGLGLAITRRLVEAWGGSIDVESEEGAGARVRIRLRAGRGSRPASA